MGLDLNLVQLAVKSRQHQGAEMVHRYPRAPGGCVLSGPNPSEMALALLHQV